MRVSPESKTFFLIAFPVATVGAIVSLLLDLGYNATFAMTMGPVFVVMLVFMLRERDESKTYRRTQSPPHGRV